jgi:prophage maintenance system killer protein
MKQPVQNEILLYRGDDGRMNLEVSLREESVWLSQQQMAQLFDRDRTVVARHLHNIFATKELDPKSNVQKMHIAGADKPVQFYNLDVIISVGYRVNSKRGTQFRIWATRILREHLLKGFTINQKRLTEEAQRFEELQEAIGVLARVIDGRQLAAAQASGLLRVIADYSRAMAILDDYDHDRVGISNTSGKGHFVLTCANARKAIVSLRRQLATSGQPTGLFGIERQGALAAILGNLYQTFDGRELYPTVEEKAAHLLYFLVKDHPFTDGNKRIGAFLFVWFMEANGTLYGNGGVKRIADNALVALTLLVAESRPREKDIIVKVIVNLINKDNN